VPPLAAAEREHDRAGTFASDNLELLIEAGLLTLNVPSEYGGLGQTLSGTVETLRILAQGSPSTALMLAMHTSVLSHYLIDPAHIPAAQRTEYAEQRAWAYREAINGKVFGVANSEPGAAGNVKNSRAEVRDGRLYGVKSFCSMGTRADYFMSAARSGSEEVQYWLVANDRSGVRVESAWDAMGMRSSESVSLRFDGAPVVHPLAYRGLIDGVNNRHWSTLAFTAIFIGIAESLLDDVAKPGSGILQASGAVDLHLTLQAARGLLRHCVATEPAPTSGEYRNLVRDTKLFVTRSLAQQASALYLAQGGSAYRFQADISRKLRDLLAGPALRPPVGVSFDELWAELSAE
jgi:alkylation response protein AidB-like acyl-CoA dehydrogenase